MSRRQLVGVLIATCTALLVTSCSQTLEGKPVSVFDDPFQVAGMRAVDGDTGLRPDAEPPSREVTNSDGGDIDELAASAVSDIEEFWKDAYGETFDGEFSPVSELISWDANGFDGQFCGDDTYGLVNAAYCPLDDTIGWDRGELLPALRDANGDMAVTMVMAHEYGHAIQRMARLNKKDTPTLVSEQQADCLAGVYMRWVAEGNSPRFTLSTGDGLNNLLASMISFRDPLMSELEYSGEDEHGSAFERVSAFQFGFTDGASSCAAIDLKEIGQRRGDLPVMLPADQTGEWPVTEESVRAIVEAMGTLFSPARPAAAELRRGVGVGLPRCPAQPPGVVLSGHQHHRCRPSRARADGRASRRARTASACSPATTPPTRCWSPGTCRPSRTSAAALFSTTPRPRCAPHASPGWPPRK